jgi:hypothetical protein
MNELETRSNGNNYCTGGNNRPTPTFTGQLVQRLK